MARPMLVSASDSIKVWDAEHMGILKQYGTENLSSGSNFKDVAWSIDNAKLAAVSNGCGVVLYDINEGEREVQELPKSEEQTCVCFGSGKAELYSGGATGDINLWNFISCKLEKTFESGHQSAIRRIHRMGDGRIVSACTSGDIVIWLSSCSYPQAKLASKSKSIRGLSHSAWERSILGTTSDDGIVCLWDIDKQVIKHTFSSHDAPSMDLSFSPMNHLLLASCGLDKKVIFHDIHANNIVKTIICTQPVTAVCMLSNGIHVCAGTSMGNIFKYDLRKNSEPLNSINAPSTSVQRLVLETLKERTRKEKRSSRTESASSSQRKPSNTTDKPRLPSRPIEKPEQRLRASQEIGKNRRSWSKVELPSHDTKPLNGEGHLYPSPAKSFPNLKSQVEKTIGLETPLNRSNVSSRRDTLGSYCEGVFSPVASVSESVQGNPFSSQSRSKTPNITRENTSQRMNVHPNFNSSTTSDPKMGGKAEQINNNNGPETPVFRDTRYNDVPHSSVTEKFSTGSSLMYSSTPPNPATNSASTLSPDSEASRSCQRLTSRNNENSVSTMVNGDHVEGATASDQQPNFTQSNPFQYQLDFLRNTVRDLVEEHEDNIRDEVRHLHMQIIKMFTEQNERIRQLAEQCSVNPLLLQEIERLRNENDRLRRKF